MADDLFDEAPFRDEDGHDRPLPPAWELPNAKLVAEQRLERLRRMRADPAVARAANAIYVKSIERFIDDWAITYDPRIDPPMLPFNMFPRQRELLVWTAERDAKREDGIVEKSRDMGCTWLFVCYAVHSFLYRPGCKISFGSRKESLVDEIGNPDSILEKARILLKALPRPLLPDTLRFQRDMGFLKLVNRENGATITGEAGNNIGRGGRSTIYIVDEAAFLERPDRVEAALSQNSDCKIYLSTANGPGNPFFRKRHSGRYPVFTFHWTQDPRKDREWAKAQRDKLEPWVYASEVEIDYHAALSDVAIPGHWVRAAQEIRNYLWIEPGSVGVGGLDVGVSGGAKCVFVPRFGPVVLAPLMWEGVDTTTTAMRAIEIARQRKLKRLNYDSIGVGAGVSAGLRNVEDIGVFPVNVGDRPTNATWPDGRRSREKFGNLKSELWWRMRDRFEKTHSTLLSLRGDGKAKCYPCEDLIALPPGQYPLLTELSAVRAFHNQQGKIVIESKEQLHRRGVASPDHADALALSFAPPARMAYSQSFHV